MKKDAVIFPSLGMGELAQGGSRKGPSARPPTCRL